MKSIDYRDALIQLTGGGRKTFIYKDTAKRLIFRYLCEKGWWIPFVNEVRRQHPNVGSAQDILDRMAKCTSNIEGLLRVSDSTFDWNKTLDVKEERREGNIGYKGIWQRRWKEWNEFCGKLYDSNILHEDKKTSNDELYAKHYYDQGLHGY